MQKNKTKDIDKIKEKAIEYLKRHLDVDVTGYKIWKDTGITEASISNYRNDKSKPTYSYAKTLIDYFESERYLLSDANNRMNYNENTIIQKNDLKDRLTTLYKELINLKAIDSKSDFAKLLETSEYAITQALGGNGDFLNEPFLDQICYYLPNINAGWLKNGEQPMYHGELKVFRREVTPVPQTDYIMVEYIDLRASAGRIGGSNIDQLPDTRKRLIAKEYENGNYLVVRVTGDSMYDGTARSLSDGDEVLIKELKLFNGEEIPFRNNLFVITSREGHVIKQITDINRVEEYILCHSFNPIYEDFKIYFRDLLQLFLVKKFVYKSILT